MTHGGGIAPKSTPSAPFRQHNHTTLGKAAIRAALPLFAPSPACAAPPRARMDGLAGSSSARPLSSTGAQI